MSKDSTASQDRTATYMAGAEPSQPRGVAVSGKTMTVGLLLILLTSGLLFYWVTTSYATYNAARRQTDQSWRNVAALLESRYKALDGAIASAGATQLDSQLVQKWRTARDAFSGTALTAHQVDAAGQLESLLSQFPEPMRQSIVESEELRAAAADYRTAIDTQQHVGHTPGSRLLKSMLVLPDPLEFHLAGETK